MNSLCAEADDLAHPPRESHQPKCIVVISSQAAGGSLYPVYVHGVPCGIFSHWSVESKRRLTSLSQDSASGPVCMSSVVDVHRKWTVCCLAEGVRRSFCLICRNLRTFALARSSRSVMSCRQFASGLSHAALQTPSTREKVLRPPTSSTCMYPKPTSSCRSTQR